MQYQFVLILFLVLFVFWLMYAMVVYNPTRDYIQELTRRGDLILEEYVKDISDKYDDIPLYRIREYITSDLTTITDEDIYGKTVFHKDRVPIVYLNIRNLNGQLRHIDVSTVILIHELAHLLQEKTGHDDEFTQIQNELLEIAYQMELIDRTVSIDS